MLSFGSAVQVEPVLIRTKSRGPGGLIAPQRPQWLLIAYTAEPAF
jgi:hypothetical protein